MHNVNLLTTETGLSAAIHVNLIQTSRLRHKQVFLVGNSRKKKEDEEHNVIELNQY